jgi:catechol 2,3-dioxygenase-like lactoylglutathione lyase family enzyme
MQQQAEQRGLRHVALRVADLARALDFQERALGAVRSTEACGAGSAITHVGHTRFLLLEIPDGGESRTRRADAPGAFHVCVSVPDVRAAHGRLGQAGVTTSAPPAELLPGLWSVYFRDPDGVHYQLLETPGDAAIHHVAVNVADLGRSLAWYEGELGALPVHRGAASGELSSRLLEVPDAAYEVALLPLPGILLELMQWTSPPGEHAPAGERGLGGYRVSLELEGTASLVDPDGLRLTAAAPHPRASGGRSV